MGMVRFYSMINESDFEDITCKKKEFIKYGVKSNVILDREKKVFQLKPHQQWLANYINPKTPFKGILVYHETGTGKTCTAISIAENFRNEIYLKNQKIHILSSENIKDEFLRTIANPGDFFKCTGDTYHEMISNKSKITQDELNNKIKEFYNFVTNHTFGKNIMDDVKKLSSEKRVIEYIKENYSNS